MRVYTLEVSVLFLFLVFSCTIGAQQESAHRATDSAGRITVSTYDSNGQLVSTTDGTGNIKHLAGVAASAPASTENVRTRSAQSAAPSVIIHVPADQPTIQAAINAANNGDTVLVSDGTYKENIDFNGKAITVTSVNGPSKSTIDGGNLDVVVKFTTAEGLSSVLDGFTITHGNSIGIDILSASPTIKNNLITANTGCQGVGIDIGDGSPLVRNNTVTNNSQTTCFGGLNGGITVGGPPSGPQIIGNTISGNNTSLGTGGGGISLNAVGPVLIQGNLIAGNVGYRAGGIGASNDTSQVRIIENVITGNTGATAGGIEIDNTASLILNNTVAGNDSSGGASAFYGWFFTSTGAMTISNNLFIGKPGQPAVGCRGFDTVSPPVFSFNNVFTSGGPNYGSVCIDQTGKNGNISADPLFVDPAVDNYHLQPTSPAIDAGSNTASTQLPPTDFDGNPRIFHNTVDMGAFEYQGTTTTTFSSTSLTFAAQLVGTTSTSQVVTIANTGSTALQIIPFNLAGDFSENDTCHTSHGIAAGQSCTISISFAPTARGTRTGQLTVTSNDAASPTNINLAGTGIAPVVSLSVTSLTFANQPVNTTSSAQHFMLTNTGDAPLTLVSIAASGDFAQTNNCGTTVGISTSCTVSVTFTPTATGPRAATIAFTDNSGGVTGSTQIVSLSGTGTVLTGDFDRDGKADVAVWRPSNGVWFVISNGSPGSFLLQQWGTSGDIPVPGDYDGDGKTDFAVWRPSIGTWYVIPSSNPSSFLVQQWGESTDIPVPGDYDGDGKTDFAVWRPSNGTWYVIPSKTPSSFLVQQWGVNEDKPVPGDYDGDGRTDFAVWRPSNGTWYVIPSKTPSSFLVQQWGVSTDIPTPADYDGDRKTDFAVWRPSNGTWYVIPSSAPTNFSVTQWGTNGDVPVQKPIGQ